MGARRNAEKQGHAGSKFKLIVKYKDVYLHIDAEDDDEGEDDDEDDDDSGPMDSKIHGLLWVKNSKKKDEILGAPIVKRGYRLDAYVLRTVYYLSLFVIPPNSPPQCHGFTLIFTGFSHR